MVIFAQTACRNITALALLILASVGPAVACGQDSNCSVGDRFYRIHLPSDTPPDGALIFAHGFRGTAAGVIKNKALTKLADDLGIALVAPKSVGGGWDIPGTPSNPDSSGEAEFTYFDAVIDDLVARHGVNKNRIVMSGFSAGGMLAWNLACHRSEKFAAFIPMSGTFWTPVPEECTSPVTNIIHIHGDSDGVVPQKGRKIKNTSQGSVIKALEMYQNYGEFDGPQQTTARLSCEARRNPAGNLLDFCQFKGGHNLSVKNIRTAWERLVDAGQP